MPTTAPKRFLDDLRSFDPLLRCRWSTALDCYLIERKVTRGKPIAPKVYADDETVRALTEVMEMDPDPSLRRELDHRLRFMAEEYQAARDGYIVLMEVQANCLDTRVFYTLWDGDIQRRGGADKVNAQIDARQASAARERDRARRAGWRQIGKDGKQYMNRPRVVPEKFSHTAPPGGMSICD